MHGRLTRVAARNSFTFATCNRIPSLGTLYPRRWSKLLVAALRLQFGGICGLSGLVDREISQGDPGSAETIRFRQLFASSLQRGWWMGFMRLQAGDGITTSVQVDTMCAIKITSATTNLPARHAKATIAMAQSNLPFVDE